MSNVRDIEKIIDEAHKGHAILKLHKKQATHDILATFEDMCSLVFMGSMLNPFSLKQIVDKMDALNMALAWVNQSCPDKADEVIVYDISETRYAQCCDFLNQYAYPYSAICSGYIAYSRKRFDATVDGTCVTFDLNAKQNSSAWNDILREGTNNDFLEFSALFNPFELLKASSELKKQISVEDEMICYSLTESILDTFRKIAQTQWDLTKTLPSSWVFDLFTMEEYRTFWVALTTLCYIHFCSCFAIENPLIRLKNSLIIQSPESIAEYISSQTTLSKSKIETILNYITFDPAKKNVDIMYQPIVKVGEDQLLIAPMLFMGSRPERNLLAVISTMHDTAYSKEVNDLEGLMVSELESFVNSKDTVKHKHLRDDLPDLDFAVLDRGTNSALICETKWFAAADSSKEVYAKEDEINHGCQQVEDIMAYAMADKNHFFKQVFGIENGEMMDLFWCVVAKHNIRTQNKNVPVIDLKRIEELFSSHSLNTVFHCIRNHEYEIKMPEEVKITHQEIDYAGYRFKIPALCFGNMSE